MNTTNQTIAQKKVLADKPKRSYKRQTKATRVRKLLATGMPIAEIAAKAKVTASYVYHIRWYDNKAAGIASLRKKSEVLGTDQVPFKPLPDTPPASQLIVGSVSVQIADAPPVLPKPTFWQRVRDFVGL